MKKWQKSLAKVFEYIFMLGVPVGISLAAFYTSDIENIGAFGKFGLIGIFIALLISYAVHKRKIKPYYVEQQQILSVHKADYEKTVNAEEKEKLALLIKTRKKKLTAYHSICLAVMMLLLYSSVAYIEQMADQLQSILGFTIISMGIAKVIAFKFDIE